MKAALLLLIEGVAILFGAFGGYLNVVAPPPGSNSSLSAVGLASFAALVIFAVTKLLIIVLNDESTNRFLRWGPVSFAGVSGVIFLVLSFIYLDDMDRYSFEFPVQEGTKVVVLVSAELTAMGQKLLDERPDLAGAHAAILAKHGSDRIHEIWTAKGIVDKRQCLNKLYVFMVLFLCLSIGFSIEGAAVLAQQE